MSSCWYIPVYTSYTMVLGNTSFGWCKPKPAVWCLFFLFTCHSETDNTFFKNYSFDHLIIGWLKQLAGSQLNWQLAQSWSTARSQFFIHIVLIIIIIIIIRFTKIQKYWTLKSFMLKNIKYYQSWKAILKRCILPLFSLLVSKSGRVATITQHFAHKNVMALVVKQYLVALHASPKTSSCQNCSRDFGPKSGYKQIFKFQQEHLCCLKNVQSGRRWRRFFRRFMITARQLRIQKPNLQLPVLILC